MLDEGYQGTHLSGLKKFIRNTLIDTSTAIPDNPPRIEITLFGVIYSGFLILYDTTL